MPLVRIDLLRGRTADQLSAIGACVHRAMVSELDVPHRDDFQILTEHDPDRLTFDRHYLDIDRSDEWILVHVTLAAGRSGRAKRAFYSALTQLLSDELGLRRQDLAVVLVENGREDWCFGNGEANYVTLPKDQWR